jgi:hypothetical protein
MPLVLHRILLRMKRLSVEFNPLPVRRHIKLVSRQDKIKLDLLDCFLPEESLVLARGFQHCRRT